MSWGTGVHDFDNDGVTTSSIVHGRPGPHGPAGALDFPQRSGAEIHPRTSRSAAGAFFEQKTVGRGAAFCRLRQRWQGGLPHCEPRWSRLPAAQHFPGRGSLDCRSAWSAARAIATGSARASRRWRAGRPADARSALRARISVAGRPSRSLRLGAAANVDRLTVRMAERRRSRAAGCAGGPHHHDGGEVKLPRSKAVLLACRGSFWDRRFRPFERLGLLRHRRKRLCFDGAAGIPDAPLQHGRRSRNRLCT